jgi:hypothetical protein
VVTPLQYDRWVDFARRMARHCFNGRTNPDAEWILAQVDSFFAGLCEHDIPCIVDWDHSTDYPEGSEYAEYGAPYCVADMVSEWEDPSSVHACYDDIDWHWADIHEDLFDDDSDIYDEVRETWFGPVRCCIRAGLDCASAPSAGVVGFTAGDLRAMYPEGVPEWVMPSDERLMYWFSNRQNGYFRDLPDSAGVVL